MAMATYLQMVNLEELAQLEADPTTINALNQDTSVATHFACTLNYFLTGSAYPDDHPLAALMQGSREVDAPTLENGRFGVIDPSETAALVDALSNVDIEALRKAVEAADIDELVEEEELYELEVMEHSEVQGELVEVLASLLAFYRKVSEENAAVVVYTQ
ncbi:MAG: hypothetical protein ACI9KE_005489 [Polyangiales bacterium]|jgi:hypothetical protein